MPRYTILPKHSRPKAATWYDDERFFHDKPLLPEIETGGQEPTPTGILDATGQEYMRLPERIGYRWWKDK